MPRHALWSVVISLTLVVGISAGPLVVHAQTNTAAIVGTVTDPTGSVIPGARVQITHQELQATFTVETGATGAYSSPVLRPGPYTVRVEAPGFQTHVQRNIVLHVNDRLRINVEMQPGAVTQVVEVTAAPGLIETESGDVGAVIEEDTIVDLPLDGRRYIDLMLLSPGVVLSPGLRSNPREGRFSVTGMDSLQNYFVLSGVDNNSFTQNAQDRSPQVARPAPDALREFKIQTRTYSAEFGYAMGGVVNAEIKSGTNEFHGATWYFHRNDNLNATNFFANRSGLGKPEEIRNQWGFAIGGPIWRDHSFFFFDYDWFHRNKGQTAGTTVPTALWRAGDFSEAPIAFNSTDLANFTAALPAQLPCLNLDDPVNPTQLLGLNLTASRTDGQPCGDPVGLALVDLYPLPTGPGLFEFQGAPQVPIDQNSFDIRIDQRLGDNDSLYGSFSFFDNEAIIERGAFEDPLAPGGFSAVADVRSYHNSISWIHTFTPTVLNTARFGFNLVRSISSPLAQAGNAGPDFGLTGLPGTFAFGLPPIRVGGFGGYEVIGTNSWRPQFSNSQIWQFIDNLSYVRGQHELKFGFEWKRAINNFLDIRSPNGEIVTGPANFWAKDGVANLLLGNVSQVRATSPLVPHRYVDGLMFYAQDSWRATPTLTLNYGVRYEYFTPWIERDRLTTSFDPEGAGGRGVLLTAFDGTLPTTTQCTFQCLVQVTGDSIFGRTLINPDRNNVAPRFSFAWNAQDRVVLRGGAAVFYQAIDRFGSSGNLHLNPPQFFENVVTVVTPSDPPAFLLRDGFPPITSPPTDLGDPTGLFIRGQDPDSTTPYSLQWSLGPQIEVVPDLAFEIVYVGSKSNHLRRLLDISQGFLVSPGVGPVVFPFPDWGTIGDFVATEGSSNYHSLQINARKRYSHGLMFNIAYTYGKALGDTQNNLSGGSVSSQTNPQNFFNRDADYGPLNFDQTHRLVAHWQWELPFGPGQPWLNQGLAAKLLGDWQFNGIWSSTSGVPITITADDASNTRSGNSRADCLANPSGPRSVEQYRGMFPGSSAFAQPAAFTFGSCGVGTMRAWPHHRGDFSLFKKFRFTEERWVELRFEFFNVFNTPQFAGPVNDVNSGSFGETRQVEDPDRDARVIQLGVKIYF